MSSTDTISDDDLLSSHSSDLLNASMVSSLGDEANECEEFPPTQVSQKGVVFASLAAGHDEYCEATFVAPPSEEGAANNQDIHSILSPALFVLCIMSTMCNGQFGFVPSMRMHVCNLTSYTHVVMHMGSHFKQHRNLYRIHPCLYNRPRQSTRCGSPPGVGCHTHGERPSHISCRGAKLSN